MFSWWNRRNEELAREIIRNRISALILGAATYGKPEELPDAANRTRIENVLRWIHGNLSEDISTADMARVSGLSLVGFHQHFKNITGCSPKDWLMSKRVERAAVRLREDPTLTVTSLAHELGFSSSHYFATVFRRYLGVSPSDFRS